MHPKTRTIVLFVIGALCVVALLGIFRPDGFAKRDEAAVRSVVTDFGAHLKDVSLLAPDAGDQIVRTYGPYTTERLVSNWKTIPEKAPGRLTSSPWPDSIQIVSVAKQGEGYIVQGNVIFRSSTDFATSSANVIPVIAQVIPTGGGWKIAGFEEQATTTRK